MIWRYDARWARSSYRPTVVETGNSPWHYPSPPNARFGVTMPLDTALPPCREVLHRPLVGRFAAEGCSGELLRVEGMPGTTDKQLIELRRHHRQRLEPEHTGAPAVAWRQRHFPDP